MVPTPPLVCVLVTLCTSALIYLHVCCSSVSLGGKERCERALDRYQFEATANAIERDVTSLYDTAVELLRVHDVPVDQSVGGRVKHLT